ncbi:MAG: hypothetical protein QGG40_11670 [Myxococcota bacterium]|nr:hypothetical protein [Myxococcota bacterium]
MTTTGLFAILLALGCGKDAPTADEAVAPTVEGEPELTEEARRELERLEMAKVIRAEVAGLVDGITEEETQALDVTLMSNDTLAGVRSGARRLCLLSSHTGDTWKVVHMAHFIESDLVQGLDFGSDSSPQRSEDVQELAQWTRDACSMQ